MNRKVTLRQDACRDCPRLVNKTYSLKQMLTLTASIMGVLAALGVALVVILVRLHPSLTW